MRSLLIAATLVLAVAPAHAISRYESMRLTCDQARAAVATEGAVILRYRSERNPSLPLYDRYVAHGGYCSPQEYAQTVYVPTSDTGSCPVYRCQQRNFDSVFPR